MKVITKNLIVLGMSLLLLVGCGNPVDFKNTEDRSKFTDVEIEAVQEKIASLDGVESFEITRIENGVYAILEVKKRDVAKDLAVEAFNSMWRETTGFVDLFVKESGKEDILIQAFKPAGTDKENKWDILL